MTDANLDGRISASVQRIDGTTHVGVLSHEQRELMKDAAAVAKMVEGVVSLLSSGSKEWGTGISFERGAMHAAIGGKMPFGPTMGYKIGYESALKVVRSEREYDSGNYQIIASSLEKITEHKP